MNIEEKSDGKPILSPSPLACFLVISAILLVPLAAWVSDHALNEFPTESLERPREFASQTDRLQNTHQTDPERTSTSDPPPQQKQGSVIYLDEDGNRATPPEGWSPPDSPLEAAKTAGRDFEVRDLPGGGKLFIPSTPIRSYSYAVIGENGTPQVHCVGSLEKAEAHIEKTRSKSATHSSSGHGMTREHSAAEAGGSEDGGAADDE